MQFIDLKKQYLFIDEDVKKRLEAVLEHGLYIMGPEVAELETTLAEYVNAKHCVAVSNGSDALLMALMALGVGPGDEVITTPFTFIAPSSMTHLLGATPVFVDIDPSTYNLNPEHIEAAITERTKAILPVDLYGQCANYTEINAIAKRHHLPVIADAAQSFGASHHGVKAGALADITCTSFFPSKPLGGYGEGGAVFTNDDALFEKLESVRNHGQEGRYHHVRLGINGRLDSMQAAVLLSKMTIFENEINLRQQVAAYYKQYLSPSLKTPVIKEGNISAFAQYTIEVDNRDAFCSAMQEKGVPTAVHYPAPLHQQPLFVDSNKVQTPLPCAEKAAKHVVSLPFYPYLEEEEVKLIAETVNEVIEIKAVA